MCDLPVTREGADDARSNVNDLYLAGPALDGLATGNYEGCTGGGPDRGAHGGHAGGGATGAPGGRAGRPAAGTAGAAARAGRGGVRRTWVRTTAGTAGVAPLGWG